MRAWTGSGICSRIAAGFRSSTRRGQTQTPACSCCGRAAHPIFEPSAARRPTGIGDLGEAGREDVHAGQAYVLYVHVRGVPVCFRTRLPEREEEKQEERCGWALFISRVSFGPIIGSEMGAVDNLVYVGPSPNNNFSILFESCLSADVWEGAV